MLSQTFIQKMRLKLEEEKKAVEQKIKKLSQPEPPMDNPDQEDIAQDATEDILEEKLLDVYEGIFEKINNALDRIKNGAYGRCAQCRAEIKEEDLAKEPWAEHCGVCRR